MGRDVCGETIPRLAVALTCLGHHDQPFSSHLGIGHAKGSDTAASHAFHFTRDLLNLLGIQVSPSLDDDVLQPGGDEKFTLCLVAKVPCV